MAKEVHELTQAILHPELASQRSGWRVLRLDTPPVKFALGFGVGMALMFIAKPSYSFDHNGVPKKVTSNNPQFEETTLVPYWAPPLLFGLTVAFL